MCEDDSVCGPFLLPTEILTVLSHGGAPVKPLISVVIVGQGALIVRPTFIVISHILYIFIVRATRHGLLHDSETIGRDVNEFVEIR
jgi:hypothetical protein